MMADYGRYKLSFNDAKNKIDAYDSMNDTEFNDQIRHWAMFDVPEENYGALYKDIRMSVVDTFKQALEKSGNKINYYLDLTVGIKLYEMLNPNNGFDVIKANDDDIWRYISVCVMPDLTFIRYPNQSSDIDVIREYIPDLTYIYSRKIQSPDFQDSGPYLTWRISPKSFFNPSNSTCLVRKCMCYYINSRISSKCIRIIRAE